MQIYNINDLVNLFKFGYEGSTEDLLYLGLCLYTIFKISVYLWKRIKKKGDFAL